MSGMADIPLIISVDDHVVEPPDLWTSRLPKKYLDRGPRVERDSAVFHFEGGNFTFEKGVEGGEPCDWWLYDDLVYPFPKLSAAVGFPELDVTPTTFDEIRAGCWKQPERLADMDTNYTEASICFPNTLPRFCGQTFYERADHDLALLCVQAYNDWVIDEWCAGDGKGRLIPLALLPLWDVDLCVQEIQRAASKGCFAVTFPENPYPLGLPSIHDKDKHWDPVFAACQDTETVICMHIGSSSKMPTTSPDAPFIVSSTLTFSNAMGSMVDYIFSGTLERFPKLTLAYSEGQVGWMPYVMERADKLWEERSANSLRHLAPGAADELREADLRLHLRRRDRPRQPRRDRHGPDLLRDRLPARRLHVPALQGHRGEDLLGGRAERGRDLQVHPRQRHPRLRAGALRHHEVARPRPLARFAVAWPAGTERGGVEGAVPGVLGFERERVRQRHVFAAAVEPQHLGHRAGRGDLGGELSGGRQQVVVGHDVVHEADAQRLVGVDEVAGDRHLGRLADPDRPRQQRREAPVATTPKRACVSAKRARSDAMIRVELSAISSPPETHAPLTAQITGLLMARSARPGLSELQLAPLSAGVARPARPP